MTLDLTAARPIQIATLLASHNRRAKTLMCLRALAAQVNEGRFVCDIYLVDAGSTDGSVDAVRDEFPHVNIVSGSDRLFWCGAMRVAWALAMRKRYDHLLLLNDDTVLVADAVRVLLDAERQARARTGHPAIVAGSTVDPVTRTRSYGGLRRGKSGGDVPPSDSIEPCDQVNCNCTLVPVEVAEAVGELEPRFTHALADHDYSLRALAKGFSVWVAPGYLGTCEANQTPAWADPRVPLRKRWKALHSPKGLPPREWVIFCRRHLPYQWPLRAALLYLHVLLPWLWLRERREPATVGQ